MQRYERSARGFPIVESSQSRTYKIQDVKSFLFKSSRFKVSNEYRHDARLRQMQNHIPEPEIPVDDTDRLGAESRDFPRYICL